MKKLGLLIFLASVTMPALSYADNTACTGAISVTPDGAVHTGTLATIAERRWFTFEAKANRSYVINVDNLAPTDGTPVVLFDNGPAFATDCAGTALAAGTVVIATWDVEPANGTVDWGGDRSSVMTVADSTVMVSINAPFGATGASFAFRVEDSTQVNTFFSTFSGYNSFYRMSNTTNGALDVFIKVYRDGAGGGPSVLIKSLTLNIPANSSAPTQNTTVGGWNIPPNTGGFVVFCHDGPSNALALDGFLMQGTTVLPIKIVDARQKR